MKRLRPRSLVSALGSALGSALVLALAAGLGCGDTTTTANIQFSFDRPIDVAFACYGSMELVSENRTVVSAMPTSACDRRALPRESGGLPEDVNIPEGQKSILNAAVQWYGLVLESGPGTVNAVKFNIQYPGSDFTSTIPDSDSLTPSKNGISVGEEPVAIVTDRRGCHAVTANAGSCDLSVLDLDSVLDDARDATVDRLAVTNLSGAPIRARPAAMVGEPSIAEVGEACPTKPEGLVYIAYPSCHLVAGVNAQTGAIVTGVQFDAAGAPSIVTGDVSCPDECGGGGAATPGVRPVTLDFEVDARTSRRRLAIGAENSASITVVDLDDASRPSTILQVALEDKTGTLGVSQLALSPDIGMGGGTAGGDLPDPLDDEAAGGAFQFVYAVATDGTVRVADVLDLRKECDTQVDPRFTRQVASVRDLACFPVGEATTPPRRAGARGPGIELPSDAIPLSPRFFRVERLPPSSDSPDVPEVRSADQPTTLIGDFAVVTSSNGATYLVNVDDDDYPDLFQPGAPLSVSMPLAMAHQLRDARGNRFLTIDDEDQKYVESDPNSTMDDRTCDYSGKFDGTTAVGGPRAVATPERKPPTGTVATEKLTELPGFRQVVCDRRDRHGAATSDADYKAISELQYAVPSATRDAAFPDLMALPEAETWSLVWEGSLSLNTGDTAVDGPAIRESLLTVDSSGLHVRDDEKPFCEAGVEPYDILQLRGCDPQATVSDCPSGYTCFVHPESKISGLGSCMLSTEADRLANACKDYLTSVRRYTVATATSGELLALPRRYELRTTPLDGCVSDDQCETLAHDAGELASSKHPINLSACNGDGVCSSGEDHASCPSDCPATWSCVADPLRAPKAGTGKRCELRCDTTADCLTGTICQGAVPGQSRSGFCMESVIPPQACINASQRYELHAGEAFAVIGSRSGFVHPIIEGANGACVRDPNASPLAVGRLPLAPHDPQAPSTPRMCDPTADPMTGRLPGGGFEPNPCLTTVAHTDVQLSYAPIDPTNPACALTGSALVERQAPAVRFRNRSVMFTLVDPYYPGDASCILDRQGNLGQIPQVVSGYSLSFRQVGGFVPLDLFHGLGVEERPSFPVKVVRGPANSVWVVDEGDFLSTTVAAPSSRGKVLRFDPLKPLSGGSIKDQQ
jgi:hypothetical protein